MRKDVARAHIKDLIALGAVVHPQRARDLYRTAELPIPEHLQERPLTEEERADLTEMGRRVTAAFFPKEDETP